MVGLHRAVDEAGELVGVLDLLVVDELELGSVAQRQRTSDCATQKARSAVQSFRHFFRRVLARERHEEDARSRHIRRHAHRGDRDVADARIAHFARHQRRQHALHLALDATQTLRFGAQTTSLTECCEQPRRASNTRSGRRRARPGSSSRRCRTRCRLALRQRRP